MQKQQQQQQHRRQRLRTQLSLGEVKKFFLQLTQEVLSYFCTSKSQPKILFSSLVSRFQFNLHTHSEHYFYLPDSALIYDFITGSSSSSSEDRKNQTPARPQGWGERGYWEGRGGLVKRRKPKLKCKRGSGRGERMGMIWGKIRGAGYGREEEVVEGRVGERVLLVYATVFAIIQSWSQSFCCLPIGSESRVFIWLARVVTLPFKQIAGNIIGS